jgi:hypothetical protein
MGEIINNKLLNNKEKFITNQTKILFKMGNILFIWMIVQKIKFPKLYKME